MPEIPTKKEISKLPKWAVVAFACRCARRTQPLYKPPDLHKELDTHIMAVESAIAIAEACANFSNSDPEKYAAAAARIAAKIKDAPSPTSSQAAAAVNAAAAAANAAAYAIVNADASPDAYIAAKATAEANSADKSRKDFVRLSSLSRREHWTEKTPVDHWKKLGRLWPEGEPEWFQEGCIWFENIVGQPLYDSAGYPIPLERTEDGLPEYNSGDQQADELQISIRIPAGADPDEVRQQIKELVRCANAYHHSLGGRGLTVDDVEVFQQSVVPVGAGQ